MFVTNENLQTIRSRWPDIYAMLSIAKYSPEDVSFSNTPSPSIVFKGIQLNSGYDRNREAHIQASIIPNDFHEATVYGLGGSGELFEYLLRRPALKKLTIVLLNAVLAKTVLQISPEYHWLQDNRVTLKYGNRETKIETPFAAIPSSLVLADQACERIRDLVNLELATPFINQRHAEQEQHLLTTRFKKNAQYIQQDRDVQELFGSEKDQTILIAAAGPTLLENLPLLRELQATSTLIALDAALPSLATNNIYPALTICQDAHPTFIHNFLNINDQNLQSTALVYFPTVHSSALQCWQGDRFTAYTEGSIYRELQKKQPKGVLFSAGSVIHPAVDLAVKMGAVKIIFIGADFGFPDGTSHAEGCPVRIEIPKDSCRVEVINGHGRYIATWSSLLGFLRDLESYIARYPGISFLNMSRNGAVIHGTDYVNPGSR